LTAAACRDGFLFSRDLAERSDGDVVISEDAQGKVSITMEAGFFGLTLHVDDLANGFLVARIETGPGMKGYVLSGKCRYGREHAKQ
jgi:hypothetical protein